MVLARFFCPRDRGFTLSLCPGGGEFALSKKLPGVARGNGQALNSLIHKAICVNVTPIKATKIKVFEM